MNTRVSVCLWGREEKREEEKDDGDEDAAATAEVITKKSEHYYKVSEPGLAQGKGKHPQDKKKKTGVRSLAHF